MKHNKLVILFVSALAIAGCSGNGLKEDNPVEGDGQGSFSLMASTEMFTKTEVCACREINWKSGDRISVWEKDNSSNANLPFNVAASSVGEPVGRFTGTLTPASSSFVLYAVYPYSSAYGSDPTSVSLTIPTVVDQAADINEVVGVSDFMMGRTDDSLYDSETGAYKMLFQHPLAFVQFHIDGRDCVYEEATIKSLTMTADVAFVGDVTMNCEDGTITSAAIGDEGRTLVINFPSTARMSDPQDAWVAINPVDLTDAGCKFELEMTNGQKVTFTVNPKVMKAQSLYKFEFADIDAKITSGRGVPTYVDLIAKAGGQRANCYIVKEGGYYRFAAQRVDKTNVFSGTQPYTDGYTAKWLWATGTESKVSSVGIGDSGNINFRVEPASNGNTVIALLDPEDNIVWSWHIWCTTEEPLTPNHYSRNSAWLMANRNIGALSDTDGGFYYQWGRKDPFPADKSACVFNTGVDITGRTSKDEAVKAGAVAYSVAHPTTFLYANDYQTWISNADDAVNAQTLWYTGNNRSGKTNYDPCPPGYLVPVSPDYAWQQYFIAGNMNFDTSGLTYTYDGVSTYYPAAGYLSGLTLTDDGTTVRVWAANINGTPSASANMQARSLLVTISSQGITKSQSSRTAFGLNVRCMKI